MANGQQIPSAGLPNGNTSPALDTLKEATSNLDFNFNSSSITDAFLEAPEALSRADLFPSLDRPLKVGTAGGSETGSVPIFVGGGDVFPTEIINSRVRAITKSASKIREENKKLEDSFAFLDTDDQYEAALNGELIDLTEEFRQKYNNDWRRARQDPDFRKRYSDLKAKGGQLSGLTIKAKEVLQAAKDNKFFVSEQARKDALAVVRGVQNFKETDLNEVLDLERSLNVWESTNAGATRIAASLEKSVTTSFEAMNDKDRQQYVDLANQAKMTGDYEGFIQFVTTKVPEANIKQLVKTAIQDGSFGDRPNIQEDLEKTISSLLTTKVEAKALEIMSRGKRDLLNAQIQNISDSDFNAKERIRLEQERIDAAEQRDKNAIASRQWTIQFKAMQKAEELAFNKSAEESNLVVSKKVDGEFVKTNVETGSLWTIDPKRRRSVVLDSADKEAILLDFGGETRNLSSQNFTPIEVREVFIANEDVLVNKEVVINKGQLSFKDGTEGIRDKITGKILPDFIDKFTSKLVIVGDGVAGQGVSRIAIDYLDNSDVLGRHTLTNVAPHLLQDSSARPSSDGAKIVSVTKAQLEASAKQNNLSVDDYRNLQLTQNNIQIKVTD